MKVFVAIYSSLMKEFFKKAFLCRLKDVSYFFIITSFSYSGWTMEVEIEEGFRLRHKLCIRYSPPQSEPIEINLDTIHKSIAQREEQISIHTVGKNNIALFGVTLIGQRSDGEWVLITSERAEVPGYTQIPFESSILQSNSGDDCALDLYFMSGQGDGDSQSSPSFPETLVLKTKVLTRPGSEPYSYSLVRAADKNALVWQQEIEEDFLEGMESSALKFSEAHKSLREDHVKTTQLLSRCRECEKESTSLGKDLGSRGITKNFKSTNSRF